MSPGTGMNVLFILGGVMGSSSKCRLRGEVSPLGLWERLTRLSN